MDGGEGREHDRSKHGHGRQALDWGGEMVDVHLALSNKLFWVWNWSRDKKACLNWGRATPGGYICTQADGRQR